MTAKLQEERSPSRRFLADGRGFTGAEKALIACFALAVIATVGALVRAGGQRAAQDAERALVTQGAQGTGLGRVVGAIRGAEDVARPGAAGRGGDVGRAGAAVGALAQRGLERFSSDFGRSAPRPEDPRNRAPRTTQPTPPGSNPNDGSGPHGAESPGLGDYAAWHLFDQIANGGEFAGLTNAARHMRHYLGNSGKPLTVDADLLVRDVPSFRQQAEDERAIAQADVQARIDAEYTGQPMRFTLTGERKGAYAQKGESKDWFYAMGGFTYWYTADVVVTPPADGKGPPEVRMEYRLHVYDRYNWDKGKAVNIGPIHIPDDAPGRLHKTGLAQEYDINGQTDPQVVTWQGAPPAGGSTGSGAGGRDGGRTDPGRDRQRR